MKALSLVSVHFRRKYSLLDESSTQLVHHTHTHTHKTEQVQPASTLASCQTSREIQNFPECFKPMRRGWARYRTRFRSDGIRLDQIRLERIEHNFILDANSRSFLQFALKSLIARPLANTLTSAADQLRQRSDKSRSLVTSSFFHFFLYMKLKYTHFNAYLTPATLSQNSVM